MPIPGNFLRDNWFMDPNPKKIPFPKDSMGAPDLRIGDDFVVTEPPNTIREGTEYKHYRIVGEDGDNWLAIRIHG